MDRGWIEVDVKILKEEYGFSFLEMLLFIAMVSFVIAIPALGLAETISDVMLRIIERVAGIGVF